jgi:chorismate synthase
VFLSKRTKADFQDWRDQRDWTARKYAMWAAGGTVAKAELVNNVPLLPNLR